MNLPNYFLADLPPEATLSPAMLTEACQTLKRNRERYLAGRSTEQLIRVLSDVAEAWLHPDNAFRKLALELGPGATGFSVETLKRGLTGFFKQITRENLNALLVQELGDKRRLDVMAATELDQKSSRTAMAVGPEFLVHITAGNIPNPTWMSIMLGLLARSAQFVKCASGSVLLPRLFAHSIYEADAKLGACLEIAEWRGGNADLENVLFAEADCVTATGGDETLAAIRSRMPMHTRFLGYGHRVSFGFVAKEVLSGLRAPRIVASAADDVVAWNQLGCLSPHVIYIQPGGEVPAEKFAEMLGDELERREQAEPRGELPAPHAAAITSRRGIYEVRAAHSPETLMWHSRGSTAWTVIFEADPRFQISCLNRFIYVKPVKDLTEMLQSAEPVRGKVSTVGIAAPEHQAEELAMQLARWGVTRVCPLGQMQNPPLTWRHDGRPALGDLVTWTDLEQ
jgi:Acyl-CoA reductase (LuxC)